MGQWKIQQQIGKCFSVFSSLSREPMPETSVLGIVNLMLGLFLPSCHLNPCGALVLGSEKHFHMTTMGQTIQRIND